MGNGFIDGEGDCWRGRPIFQPRKIIVKKLKEITKNAKHIRKASDI